MLKPILVLSAIGLAAYMHGPVEAIEQPGIRGEVGVARKAVDGGTYSTGTLQYLDCRYPGNENEGDMDAFWNKVTDNYAEIKCKKNNGDTSQALRLNCESSAANPVVWIYSSWGTRNNEVAAFRCEVTPDPYD